MRVRSDLRASIFRLPLELDNGIKVVAARRGEAAAVVVREILREGLELRGVITLQHSHGSPVQPLQPTAGAAE
jgi:hypothetical protein